MPTVPIFKPSTGLSGMPGVRQENNATPQTFGSGIAQATGQVGEDLARAGGELSRLGAQIAERQDAVAAKGAYQIASEQLRSYVHDPNTGLLARRGAEARGATNRAGKDLQKIQEDATKGLTPAQKQMFHSFWDGARDSGLTTAARHEAEQMQATEDHTNAAILDNASMTMAANARNPEMLEHQDKVARATLFSATRGESKEFYDNKLKAWRTKAYGDAAARLMVDGFTQEAVDLLNKHEAEMDTSAVLRLREQAKKKNDQTVAQKVADEMVPFNADPATEVDVLAKLNNRYQKGEMGVDAYHEAERVIQQRFSDLSRARAEKTRQDLNTGLNSIRSSPNLKAAEDLAWAAKDPTVVDNLLAFARIKHKDEYDRQETAKAISRQISANEAAENRRDTKKNLELTKVQAKYEELLKKANGDVNEVPGLARLELTGLDEAEVQQYAVMQSNIAAATSRKEKAEVSPVAKRAIILPAKDKVRGMVDQARNNNTPINGAEATGLLMREMGPNKELLTVEDTEDIYSYAEKGGVHQFLDYDTVADALDMVIPIARTPEERLPGAGYRRLQKYPGLYDAVARAMKSADAKVKAEDIVPLVAEQVAIFNKANSYWWGNNPDILKQPGQTPVDAPPVPRAREVDIGVRNNKILSVFGGIPSSPADLDAIKFLDRATPSWENGDTETIKAAVARFKAKRGER